MKALDYLLRIHRFGAGGFWSVEKPKEVASGSEVRRWLSNGALQVNGITVKANDEIDFDNLHSVVLFPNSARRRNTIL